MTPREEVASGYSLSLSLSQSIAGLFLFPEKMAPTEKEEEKAAKSKRREGERDAIK